MSTHATIWLKKDNILKGIYCHQDGYPKYLGNYLLKFYNTEDIVEKLINLGHISFLSEKLEPPEGKEHSFNKPYPFTTIAYHRDRGEKFKQYIIKISNFENEYNLYDKLCHHTQQYNYIFIDDSWYMIIEDSLVKLENIKLLSFLLSTI